jgi:mutator protein MutT
MSTPIAIAVVEHEGRFLIGQRPAGTALAGLWEFPGGKIEAGETAEDAAVRECREETGVVVEPLFRYPQRDEDYGHDRLQLHFIGCRPLSASITPQVPFRWVKREELNRYEFPTGNAEILELLAAEMRAKSL